MVTNYSLVIGQRLDDGAEISVVLTEDRSSDDHPPLTPLTGSLLVTNRFIRDLLIRLLLLPVFFFLSLIIK